MASYQTPREIAAAFLERRKPSKRLATFFAAGYDGARSLQSYGEHYVVAVDDGTGVWLNTERNSVTTNRHVTATAIELSQHGLTRTGDTAYGANGHQYEFWDRGEGNEVSPL